METTMMADTKPLYARLPADLPPPAQDRVGA